jgi:hypothetical protein
MALNIMTGAEDVDSSRLVSISVSIDKFVADALEFSVDVDANDELCELFNRVDRLDERGGMEPSERESFIEAVRGREAAEVVGATKS